MSGTGTSLRTLRFGHSPDADDAYMFYGFHEGLAEIPGHRVEHVLEDIQSLNRRALESADLEITAVSAHAYAFLADRYAVLSCGASMGIGYGPVVVAAEGSPLAAREGSPEALRLAAGQEGHPLAGLAGKRVAVPGAMTTAALLLRLECPACEPVDVMFDQIPGAIASGQFDAGVIIHESQLTYRDEGLVKLLDFGELWMTRDGLPVPLGLDVVRRDLGPELMRAVSRGFRESIEAAHTHEDAAIRYALAFGRGLDREKGSKFVHMYVNELTIDMGQRGRHALENLYRRAVGAGVIAKAPALDVI